MRFPSILACAMLFYGGPISATYGAGKAELSGDQIPTDKGILVIHPIRHASLVMQWFPYTMSVAKAAEAIRAFKPKIVYPYHYRSSNGEKADMKELKRLVGTDSGVEIRARDWYPNP